MSVHSGPDTTENGLVLYYDAGNTLKSWKGPPATNLLSNPNFDVDSTTDWSIANATTGTSALDSTVKYSGTNSLRITVSNGGDQYVHSGYNFGADVSGQSFTVSAMIRTNQLSASNTVRCFTYWQDITGTWIFTNNTPSTQAVNNGNSWTRVTASSTAPTGTYRAFILIAPLLKDGIGTYWIDDVQLEQNSFATPYIEPTGYNNQDYFLGAYTKLSTTRTSNQSLIDMTGINNVTVNSLTYAADGTFSFNGTSNSITVPFNSSAFTFDSGQTIIIWMNNQSPAAFRRNPYDMAYGGGGTITHEVSNQFNYYYGTSGSNNVPYTNHTSPFTVTVGETAMVAITRSATQTAWYKNGSLGNTQSNPYGVIVTGTNNITIGDGYVEPFAGNLYSIQLYNRSLSAPEVQQNFNALRGRYGI